MFDKNEYNIGPNPTPIGKELTVKFPKSGLYLLRVSRGALLNNSSSYLLIVINEVLANAIRL